jgi:hypothetical protein
MSWTSITTIEEAQRLLPAWFSTRMVGERGSFGLLLATGDVMRITSIMAIHHGSDGTLLIDVLLDSAGPPQGVDHAWEVKHFLGAPVPGATLATVNVTHVIAMVEFVAAEIAEPTSGVGVPEDAAEDLSGLDHLPGLVARVSSD